MSQTDNSVHQALAHLDRVNQFITTLRQLEDNEIAIAAVCRDELAHLSNTLTPTRAGSDAESVSWCSRSAARERTSCAKLF